MAFSNTYPESLGISDIDDAQKSRVIAAIFVPGLTKERVDVMTMQDAQLLLSDMGVHVRAVNPDRLTWKEIAPNGRENENILTIHPASLWYALRAIAVRQLCLAEARDGVQQTNPAAPYRVGDRFQPPPQRLTMTHVTLIAVVIVSLVIIAAGLVGARIQDQAAAACEARPGYAYLNGRTMNRCVRIVEDEIR